jgi:hypothetical protein
MVILDSEEFQFTFPSGEKGSEKKGRGELSEFATFSLHPMSQGVKVINLEYGKLENGKLKSYLVLNNGKTASPKNSNGKLEFSLENGFLEKKDTIRGYTH